MGLDLSRLGVPLLALPDLEVADLYLDLALVRARQAQAELAGSRASTLLAQGADCMSEAVAYVRDAAEQLLPPGSPRRERLEILAVALLAEAAAFEQAADLLRAGESAGGRRS